MKIGPTAARAFFTELFLNATPFMARDQAAPAHRPYSIGNRRPGYSLFALLVIILSSAFAWAGPNALLIWDDDEDAVSNHPPLSTELNANTQALINALEAAGIHVTLSKHTQSQYNGFEPSPKPFDAVIHLNGNPNVLKVMPASAVNVLVDYVRNNNGTYLGSENNAVQMTIPLGQGLAAAMSDLTLVTRTSGRPVSSITLTKVTEQASHPVLEGLPDTFSFSSAHIVSVVRSYATSPATVLMRDDENSDAVLVRDFYKGRVIYFHHAGNSSGANTFSNANVQRLYTNSVYWGDRKPPTITAITLMDASPTVGGTIRFQVQFSEEVTGVDAEDFKIVSSGVTIDGSLSVENTAEREYIVSISEVSGDGQLRIKLDDNDSIVDTSHSANPLGGTGAGNGSLSSNSYDIDSVAPALSAVTGDPAIAPVGSTPKITLVFNEAMDQTVVPNVRLQTTASALITASPLIETPWSDDKTITYTLDRAVTAEDAGVAHVLVAGAQDLLGNAMVPDPSYTYVLIREGAGTADISVAITDSRDAVIPGQQTSYQVTLTNLGPNDVRGAALSCTFPPALTDIRWTCNPSAGTFCTVQGTSVLQDALYLPPTGNAVYTIEATVAATASGFLPVMAAVTPPEGTSDPISDNNQSQDSDVVGTVPTVVISSPTLIVDPGTTFTAEITVDMGQVPLWGYELAAVYNPSVLAISKIEGGNTSSFSQAPSTDPASFSTGNTSFSAYHAVSAADPVGSISLARITFSVLDSPGESSSLDLQVNSFLDAGGETLPAQTQSASVTVSGSPAEGEGAAEGEGEGASEGEPIERTGQGLLALYTFDELSGTTVHDTSGQGNPLDLVIRDPNAVRWLNGRLVVDSSTLISSDTPASKLIEAIRSSGGLTLESWVKTAKREQSGPARILTISSGTTLRNVTLGQDTARFDVRLRSSITSANGLPAIVSDAESVNTELAHLVFTRDPAGIARIYVNGVLNTDAAITGSFSSWDTTFAFALANEFSKTRPWLGEYHLVAIYRRALTETEILQNFTAGPEAPTAPSEGEPEGIQEGEGQMEGTPEGTVEGEGQLEGMPEGVVEGEGQAEGMPEGSVEGEGQAEGMPEGIDEGEGQSEGEGSVEGEGQTEGAPEGTLEGEGQVEGTAEGEGSEEGMLEGEGQSEGEGSTEGETPGGCQCPKGYSGVQDIDKLLGDLLLSATMFLALAGWNRRFYP